MLIDRRVPNLPSGVERTRVPGGGAAVIAIAAGDRITVIDVEGRQPCEVLAADASGRVDPGLIGGKVCGIADGLRAILASGSESARTVLSGLRRRNIALGEAKAVRLFGGDSAAGAQEEFTAQGPGVLIVAAPGDAMTPEAQDTATEIEVRIARASPRSEEFALLPDPLADARLDFEVPRSSARAYEVKEGDYIQIIDLFGRQCSDFHCLNARALAEGDRARPRQHGDAHAAGARLSGAGPVRQGVRPGFPAAGGTGAGYLRAARQFRARLHGEILRGHGLSGACQLLGQFQRRAGALWREAAARLGGAQSLLQHRHRPQQRALPRRAVVAARRLRAVPRADRPGVRVVGLPGRHRRRQRLEPDAGPHPHLSGQGALLARGGLPQDSRCRGSDDQGNRVPSAPLRAHAQLHGVSRLLAAEPLQQRRADRRILGGQRARGDDRPLAIAQVRGDRARMPRRCCSAR